MNFNRVTFQHNNEFIIIILCYLMVSVITMSNLIKRLIRATFFKVLMQAMFMNKTMKTNATDKRLKLQNSTNNHERKIIR